ncbi:MAG: thioredoxin family protein [Nitratiruptor sp.]|nr:thioredoxin family protein [Nitratiruptor sp.]NPA83912.1 thioredoxin family protein [Campylobacterota bacterium]
MKAMFILWLLSLWLVGADFEWYGYQEGLAQAKADNKPILLMITQEGCSACDYMEDVAFEEEALVDFIEYNFIPIQLTIQEAKALGYRVYGTPTFYFLRSDGSPIGRGLVGAAPAKIFLKKLEEIKSGL